MHSKCSGPGYQCLNQYQRLVSGNVSQWIENQGFQENKAKGHQVNEFSMEAVCHLRDWQTTLCSKIQRDEHGTSNLGTFRLQTKLKNLTVERSAKNDHSNVHNLLKLPTAKMAPPFPLSYFRLHEARDLMSGLLNLNFLYALLVHWLLGKNTKTETELICATPQDGPSH